MITDESKADQPAIDDVSNSAEARVREQEAFQVLADTLAAVSCGTGRRARAIAMLLHLERVLSAQLGDCGGRAEYERVIDRYLQVRHGDDEVTR